MHHVGGITRTIMWMDQLGFFDNDDVDDFAQATSLVITRRPSMLRDDTRHRVMSIVDLQCDSVPRDGTQA